MIKLLTAAGWHFVRPGGRHDVYGCPCGRHTVPVPRHREITDGVERNIWAAIARCKEGR